MLRDYLALKGIKSQAKFPEVGYGQVEPNHLSAQRTGQIYAQLPADPAITMLEQGQFVKYDYAAGLVNFTGPGEWMLVYNEIKLYREHQLDCEFAMIKENYGARVYSPLDSKKSEREYGPTRFWNNNNKNAYGFNADGELVPAFDDEGNPIEGVTVADYGVVNNVEDIYELNYTTDPWHRLADNGKREKMMPAGTTMVPRVFKTNVGDLYTTNMIDEDELAVEETLAPRAADGILVKATEGDMLWQVVKVYTMPDHQRGVKLMRIK